MQVLVNGEVKELVVIGRNGIEWTEDFIEDGVANGDFVRTEIEIDGWTEEIWECTPEDFEWWENICQREQRIDDAVESEAFEALSEEEQAEYWRIPAMADLESNINDLESWLQEKGIIE